MDLVHALLLILGGTLATSGLIVAKRPDAQRYLEKLVPFQAIIGVVLLAFGVFRLPHLLTGIKFIVSEPREPVVGVMLAASVVCSIVVGFLFGLPQIIKWMPGHASAEQRALEVSQKLAPFQVIFGLGALGAGVLGLLQVLHLLQFLQN